MTNHEKKEYAESVHLLMGFQRTKDGELHSGSCVRTVIRDFDTDLKLFEYRLKLRGGIWRIHKTVNARDTEKARKWLMHKLIDNPECAGFIDSMWRTALLQPENTYGKKRFLLDVDTKNINELLDFEKMLPIDFELERYKTPNGFHYITKAFDTRKVCELPYVSLQRDGYVFIKKIGEENGKVS
jgi:hypothetical protein